MISFTVEKLLEKVRNKSFCLDCLSISLQPNWDSGVPPVTGPGEIRLNAEQQLVMKMFASHMPPRYQTETGQLVPNEAYFRLTAIDKHGLEWTCNQVLPDWECHASQQQCVATADIWELQHVDADTVSPAEVSEVTLVTFDDVLVPANARTETVITSPAGVSKQSIANLAEADVEGLHIIIENLPAGISARITGEQVPDNIELRLAEALQFALARTLRWHFIHSRQGSAEILRIRSRFRGPERPGLLPPLQFLGRLDIHNGFVPLFGAYLKYVIQEPEAAEWHELSYHLHAACEGSAGSITQQCLTLAVAVEGVLNVAFPQTRKRKSQLTEAVCDLKSYVSEWECPALGDSLTHFRQRIDGLLNNLYQDSAGRRLQQIAELGWVSADEVKAWKQLRHPTAHAGLPQE